MLPDYSKAIYMLASDRDYPMVNEWFDWVAKFKNPHVWFNLKDLSLESTLTDVKNFEDLIQIYMELQT